MFKSASYRHRNIYGAAVHLLKDDTFQALLEIDQGGLALQIVQEYRTRGLPIAPNMALYYLWCQYRKLELPKIIERDLKLIEYSVPSWQYKDKIYPCVLHQIKQRTFGRNS